jgi:hypothetical protein
MGSIVVVALFRVSSSAEGSSFGRRAQSMVAVTLSPANSSAEGSRFRPAGAIDRCGAARLRTAALKKPLSARGHDRSLR